MDAPRLSASGLYDLPSAVVHEVVELSKYERAGVPSGAEGYPFHARGVTAEDGSLMGAGKPSRTCRSPNGDINGPPRPILQGCVP